MSRKVLKQWICQTRGQCNCTSDQGIDQRMGKRFFYFFLPLCCSLCPIVCVYIRIVSLFRTRKSENWTAVLLTIFPRHAFAIWDRSMARWRNKIVRDIRINVTIGFSPFCLCPTRSTFSCSFRRNAIGEKKLIVAADNSGRIGRRVKRN